MKRISLLVILAIAVASCASTPEVNSVKASTKYDYHLFGKLENVDGSYSFTEFSEVNPRKAKGEWVRLSDMRPSWNTRTEDCLSGVQIADTGRDRSCKTENSARFRNKELDFSARKAAGYVLLTTFTLGLGAASPPAAVIFDEESFNAAVKEAEKNAGMFRKSLDDYNQLMISYKGAYNDLVSNYRVNAAPKIRVIDNSGLFTRNPRIFSRDIRLFANQVSPMISPGTLNASSVAELLSLAKKRNTKSTKDISILVSSVNVSCKNWMVKDVHYRIRCPVKISSASSEVDIDVIVDSLDYDFVLPSDMKAEDETFLIKLDGFSFYLENKTKNYVTVDSISFYHNGEVSSSIKLGHEMAPYSHSPKNRKFGILSLGATEQSMRFEKVTKKNSLNTYTNYGVALKYRVIDTDKEKTLLTNKKYQLATILPKY